MRCTPGWSSDAVLEICQSCGHGTPLPTGLVATQDQSGQHGANGVAMPWQVLRPPRPGSSLKACEECPVTSAILVPMLAAALVACGSAGGSAESGSPSASGSASSAATAASPGASASATSLRQCTSSRPAGAGRDGPDHH